MLCHVSHVYETGASLYFTVATKQADDPLAQWLAAKAAASDAMIDNGASITHHHAVGRDHKPWLAREIGPVGVGILRALKARARPHRRAEPGRADPLRSGRVTGRSKDSRTDHASASLGVSNAHTTAGVDSTEGGRPRRGGGPRRRARAGARRAWPCPRRRRRAGTAVSGRPQPVSCGGSGDEQRGAGRAEGHRALGHPRRPSSPAPSSTSADR